jgi:hypothetical protein
MAFHDTGGAQLLEDWTPSEKALYLIANLNEPAVHILHGIPIGATYVKVTKALENRYSDHYLKAAFHSQRKEGPNRSGNSCRSLSSPSTTWQPLGSLQPQQIT